MRYSRELCLCVHTDAHVNRYCVVDRSRGRYLTLELRSLGFKSCSLIHISSVIMDKLLDFSLSQESVKDYKLQRDCLTLCCGVFWIFCTDGNIDLLVYPILISHSPPEKKCHVSEMKSRQKRITGNVNNSLN